MTVNHQSSRRVINGAYNVKHQANGAFVATIMAPSSFSERMLFSLWKWKGRTGGRSTDTDFAEAVGRSQPMVTSWTKPNASPPPMETATRIAKVAQVDPGWLVFGSASSAPEPKDFAEWLERYRTHLSEEALKKLPKLKGKPASQFNAELEAEKKTKRGKSA